MTEAQRKLLGVNYICEICLKPIKKCGHLSLQWDKDGTGDMIICKECFEEVLNLLALIKKDTRVIL